MTSSNAIEAPRIVVGVDGSIQSKQALRWAAHLAAASGAHLDAVAAWDYPTTYGLAPMGDWNPEKDMEKGLTETVDEVFGTERPADMRLLVREGNASKVLLDASNGALMLIVGSRGHGGFAGLLLGSISTAVAEHATCPVLVVHGDKIPLEVSL